MDQARSGTQLQLRVQRELEVGELVRGRVIAALVATRRTRRQRHLRLGAGRRLCMRVEKQ